MAPKRTAKKSRYQPRASSRPAPRVPGTPKPRRVASPVIPGRGGRVETMDPDPEPDFTIGKED